MRRIGVTLLFMAAVCLLLLAVFGIKTADRVPRSASGVTLVWGEGSEALAVGDLTAAEVETAVASLASKVRRPASEPVIDRVTKGVIPGLAGKELDQAATVALVLAAEPGTCLEPQFLPLYPTPLADYARYPIYQGNPEKKQIALVVNVAWGNAELAEMLQILRAADVRASFFLVGRWAAKNPDLVREIAQAGHEFGNHAYSDPHLPKLAAAEIACEITRTSELITEITGQTVSFFSPPYNDFNQTVLDTAADLGYLTVLCSLDTADWLRPGVSRIVQRIVPRAHPGAIVLMHPTEQTPAALREIITGLRQQGYSLVTVSQLLAP